MGSVYQFSRSRLSEDACVHLQDKLRERLHCRQQCFNKLLLLLLVLLLLLLSLLLLLLLLLGIESDVQSFRNFADRSDNSHGCFVMLRRFLRQFLQDAPSRKPENKSNRSCGSESSEAKKATV
jgi:hypothetical protein